MNFKTPSSFHYNYNNVIDCLSTITFINKKKKQLEFNMSQSYVKTPVITILMVHIFG